MVTVTAAKGYEATTVADVLEEAGVGRETFYELFADKRDCMLAAHANLVDELEARVRLAYLRARRPGRERVRDAVATALGFLRRTAAGAALHAGRAVRGRPPAARALPGGLQPLRRPARRGSRRGSRQRRPGRPTSLAVGAVAARTYEEVVVGRAAELPRLVPELTYELLVPFVGEAAAREAAGAARRRRPPAAPAARRGGRGRAASAACRRRSRAARPGRRAGR